METLIDRAKQIVFNRAKQMVMQPKATWEVIRNEEISISNLLTSYILPLALIPAIASFIGFGFIGFTSGFFGHAASIEWGISQAIISFAGTFIGILASAWVINQLAPRFGATLSIANAVKLVAYSYTPALLAGVFYLIPSLTVFVAIGGIYSLYVLYLGFQPITNVSEEQKTGYFLLSLIVIIALFMAISFVLGIVLATIGLTGIHNMNL